MFQTVYRNVYRFDILLHSLLLIQTHTFYCNNEFCLLHICSLLYKTALHNYHKRYTILFVSFLLSSLLLTQQLPNFAACHFTYESYLGLVHFWSLTDIAIKFLKRITTQPGAIHPPDPDSAMSCSSPLPERSFHQACFQPPP